MQRFFAFQSFLAMTTALLLTACGGGGGGGPAPVVINSSATAEGMTGVTYPGVTYTASGGSGTFTWTATGALPPGLSLSTAGQLSGIPTRAGTYAVTITATDSSSPPLTNSTPISIKIGDSLIVISASPMPPAGTLTRPYPTFTFAASGGSPPFTWNLKTGALPVGLTLGSDGSITGTVSSTAVSSTFTVAATDAVNQTAPSTPITIRISPLQPAGVFTPTGSMQVPRTGHTATLLVGSQVLVAGGHDASAELYNPASESFSPTGSMEIARYGHTATLLADTTEPNYGKVLVAGGPDASAELYDPTAGSFATTGPMSTSRPEHTATLLSNVALRDHGKVLMVGGGTATAELYDPATETFSPTGSMSIARSGHTATLLLDGRVLIAGGGPNVNATSATAELYDPVSNAFAGTGSMTVARTGHTATRLPNGTVLVAGTEGTADLYDPATGTFTRIGPLPGAYTRTASLLNDGSVLLAGGYVLQAVSYFIPPGCMTGYFNSSIAAAELFGSGNQGFTLTGPLTEARDGHTATVLADGTVLIAGGLQHKVSGLGGRDHCSNTLTVTPLSSAELFR